MGTLDSHNFTDTLTELSLGAAADIRHYKLLQEGRARPAPDPSRGGASAPTEGLAPTPKPPAPDTSSRGSLRSRDRDAGR